MAAGDISTRNPLSDVQNILNIFKGSAPTTTSSTSTENVSTDKANAYLKSILESNSGLASVSSGQKAAGMYSSTVNQQLTNDLLSRTAAQTAALGTSKTTTQSQKTAPQMDLAKTLMGLGAGQILTPLVKAGSKKLGLDDVGTDISNAVFGGPSSSSAASLDSSAPIDTSGFDNLNTLLKSDTAGTSGASDFSSTSSDSSGASSLLAATGVGAAGAALASAGTGAAVTAGLADASYAIGGTGAFLAADAGATAATAAGGAGILDTLATAAAAAWIVCTELNKQGRLPYRYYIYGAREFAKYDERGKQGYYIWAIPSVKHLRKHPNSFYSRTLEVVFNARAEYLAAKAGCKGARKTTLGFLTTHGLYAFCWVLSRTIARKSYSKEQILGAEA